METIGVSTSGHRQVAPIGPSLPKKITTNSGQNIFYKNNYLNILARRGLDIQKKDDTR